MALHKVCRSNLNPIYFCLCEQSTLEIKCGENENVAVALHLKCLVYSRKRQEGLHWNRCEKHIKLSALDCFKIFCYFCCCGISKYNFFDIDFISQLELIFTVTKVTASIECFKTKLCRCLGFASLQTLYEILSNCNCLHQLKEKKILSRVLKKVLVFNSVNLAKIFSYFLFRSTKTKM